MSGKRSGIRPDVARLIRVRCVWRGHQQHYGVTEILAHFGQEIGALIRLLVSKKDHAPQARGRGSSARSE